jgi:CubicO group peptidase (beta-lactamase class C family)
MRIDLFFNRNMKLLQIGAVAFFILISSSFAQPTTAELNIKFQNVLESYQVPGMAVAVVKDNQVVFASGFGVTDIRTGQKVDENTLFGIASNTKAMTAAGLAVLVDEGKLKWNDRVQSYIPWLELYNPYVTSELNIVDILTHRAGFRTFSGDLVWYASNHSREEILRRARHLKPAYPFRAQYGYSNIMYLLAGQITEEISGQSWDAFMKERFFAPLGMHRTNTSILDMKEDKNVANPHVHTGSEIIPIPYENWDNIAPAGAVNSSVMEMTRWMMLQLNRGTLDGKRYFSEDASRMMWNVHMPLAVSKRNEELMPSMNFRGYGLGWSLYTWHGRKVVSHSGGLDGMISHLALVPEENLGFVVLTNSNTRLPGILIYQLLDLYLGIEGTDWVAHFQPDFKKMVEDEKESKKKAESERAKNTKPSLALEKYTGTYGGDLYGTASVKLEKGKLMVYFDHTPLFVGELTHWHYDTFTVKLLKTPSLTGGTVQFLLDTKGNVSEMKIDVPNPDFDFTELEFRRIN